jgi:hypothetical protein
MAFNSNIVPGRPPLLWSDVQEAFRQVNENFDLLVATVGDGSGLTPLDFETLDTNLSPTDTNTYQLGTDLKQWKSIRTAEYSSVPGSELNGLWAGSAQIKGVGSRVNLPANSTIGGDPETGIGVNLIIDPDKTFFKEIQVDNGSSVVATGFGDTVNLLSGSGINLTVNSGADSIEIDNTGILSITAGTGITAATASGVATIVNSGVRSLTNVSGLPSGRVLGAGINISAGTGDNIRITNTGILSITNGVGITVSTDAATGEVQITNSAPAVNSFAQVEINGDIVNRLLADSVSDVLNITSGQGISLTKNTFTDTLTITVDPVFDLKGSVFGDDSTKLVDAVEGKIVGDIETNSLRTSETKIAIGNNAGLTNQGVQTVAIGRLAGQTSQGDNAVAIGVIAGQTSQGSGAVAIGGNAGVTNQGASAVAVGVNAGVTSQGSFSTAIGANAGNTNQHANTIIINAGSVATNSNGTDRFFVNPIRNVSGANGVVQYDSTTKEVSYSSALGTVSGTFTGDITGSVFADDSTMLVDGVGGQIVGPINSFDGINSIIMDPINGVVIGGTAGAQIIGAAGALVYIGGGTSGGTSGNILLGNGTNRVVFVSNVIDTDDSSALIFEPPVTFNTDITFENDITVAERLTVKGSRVINLTELQTIVAASASFADFQTRIAALV